ncbi:MAG: hypothetical protein H7338_00550 [Candidatus Sericytochromatia bacterium]|nr:hypothetical protein [Candidatus Sericytochromatia bacterium]
MEFLIDLVGSCNLRCPSCPQGNWLGEQNPVGFMAPELLRKIMTKAVSEYQVSCVNLYNWTEPFLHRDLAGMMRIVNSFGARPSLSSNLNLIPNIEAVMAENPLHLVISASGFTQVTYGYTHRKGDINKVKENMEVVAKIRDSMNINTNIYVNYHVYMHNVEDAVLMKEYASSLGFGFNPAWAYMQPLEKVLGYLTGDSQFGEITAEDRELIKNFALPIEKAIAASQKLSNPSCRLRFAQMVLDHTGSAKLCCGVFDPKHANIGNYLDMAAPDLQASRDAHPLCVTCMDHGIHMYSVYAAPELQTLGLSHVIRQRIAALEDIFNLSLQLG